MLRSDEVRRELARGGDGPPPTGTGTGTGTGTDEGIETGAYAPDATARVYAALLDRARDALGAGDSVVLDASWHAPAPRRGAAALAEETGARLDALRCVAPEALCRERVRRRSAEGDDPSEATPAVADWMAAAFTPWPEAVAIDTAGPVEDSVRDAKTALEPSPSDVK